MKSLITTGTIYFEPPARIHRTWDMFPNERCTTSAYTLSPKHLNVITRSYLRVTEEKELFKYWKVWK